MLINLDTHISLTYNRMSYNMKRRNYLRPKINAVMDIHVQRLTVRLS